ncbi:hypothetical protein L6258_00645 [Candidatus Parcubacteria bacterium]|nr:hypothetical protein [Candidatus Parcubacteria bacterium]
MKKSLFMVFLVVIAVMIFSSGGLSFEAARQVFSEQPKTSEPPKLEYQVTRLEWEMVFGASQKISKVLVESENVEIKTSAGIDEDIVAIRGEGKQGYLAFRDNNVTNIAGKVVSFFTNKLEYHRESQTWRWYFELARGGKELDFEIPLVNVTIASGRYQTKFFIKAKNSQTGKTEDIELAASRMFFELVEGNVLTYLVFNLDGQLTDYVIREGR